MGQIPAALRALPRWVRRAGKVPIQTNGRNASSTNSYTWNTYEAVKASEQGDGIGFVLNGDGIVCVDLDHCIKDGRLSPYASFILGVIPPTYIEVSPSGTGLHIWGLGSIPTTVRPDIEVYSDKRYITVTDQRYPHPKSVSSLGVFSTAIRRVL